MQVLECVTAIFAGALSFSTIPTLVDLAYHLGHRWALFDDTVRVKNSGGTSVEH